MALPLGAVCGSAVCDFLILHTFLKIFYLVTGVTVHSNVFIRWDPSRLLGENSKLTMRSHVYNTLVQRINITGRSC